MTRDIEKEKQDYLAGILAFDNTEFLFDQSYKVVLHIREGSPSEDIPQGIYYDFNLFAPDASGDAVIRILGTDNAHAPADKKHPHDHWHAPKMNPAGTRAIGVKKGKAVAVTSIEEHIGKFMAAVQELLVTQGVDPSVVSVNTPASPTISRSE